MAEEKPKPRYPIFKDNNKERKWTRDNIIWKNLFKMDVESIVFFIIILYLIFSYNYEIARCDAVIENPCEFCENSGCCEPRFGSPDWNTPSDDYKLPVIDLNIT